MARSSVGPFYCGLLMILILSTKGIRTLDTCRVIFLKDATKITESVSLLDNLGFTHHSEKNLLPWQLRLLSLSDLF